MNSITVYIDETLSARDIVELKREIEALPHVIDVEHPREDQHNLTIDYEGHANMPTVLLEKLRSRGLHPDITSA